MLKLSLGTRLALIITGVLCALMVIATAWIESRLTSEMHEEKLRQAQLTSRTLISSLQTLMLNGQGTLARSWLSRMHGTAGILDLEVLRRDGKEAFADLETMEQVNNFLGFPRFQREPMKPHVDEVEGHDPLLFRQTLRGETTVDVSTPGRMTLLVPIETKQECLTCHGYDASALRGVLMLSLSTAEEDARISFVRFRIWLIAGVLVLSQGFLLWLLLRTNVLAPVIRLRDAIRRVGEGRRDMKLPVVRNDELGEVAQVFNRMQDLLQASEIRIHAVMDNVVDAIVTIDERGIIESANPAVIKLFGYEPREIIGRNVSILMPEPFSHDHDDYLQRYLKTGVSKVIGTGREIVGKHKNGRVFPVDLAVSEMRLNEKRYFIGIMRDITERKQQMAAIEYQAMHDALTDLPNRTLLSDRLHQATLNAQRTGKPLALLIMDLNHFKEINDTLGHHNGDMLLQQVAIRTRGILRESDTVARLGGDEFAVLLPTADIDHATKIANKLLGSLDKPIELDGQFLHVGGSLGIALYPDHGQDVTTLMQHADVAMYEAKRMNVGYAVYDPQRDQHSLRNLSLMGDLRIAIDENQLELFYQPKINLRTGRVFGVEALIRWRHPVYGLMYPDEFITAAEHAGLIKPLSLWVVRRALIQSRNWHQSGIDISVAINLSVRNLQDSALPGEIADIVNATGVKTANIFMEITESAMMADPQRALETLTMLGSMGIRLSIDDYGIGYSSLSYLKKLPVDEIKIDKSFVMGMSDDENDAVIVRSTIDLAHNIGLKVVAEGVENKETYDILSQLGCDAVQGYYISRPVTVGELAQWLYAPPWGLHRGNVQSN